MLAPWASLIRSAASHGVFVETVDHRWYVGRGNHPHGVGVDSERSGWHFRVDDLFGEHANIDGHGGTNLLVGIRIGPCESYH